jgi:hypothetical protein
MCLCMYVYVFIQTQACKNNFVLFEFGSSNMYVCIDIQTHIETQNCNNSQYRYTHTHTQTRTQTCKNNLALLELGCSNMSICLFAINCSFTVILILPVPPQVPPPPDSPAECERPVGLLRLLSRMAGRVVYCSFRFACKTASVLSLMSCSALSTSCCTASTLRATSADPVCICVYVCVCVWCFVDELLHGLDSACDVC